VTSGRDVQRTPYRDVRREFWSFTWPRSITGLAQIAVQRADIVVIAVLRSPAEAAVYTAATRFVVLGQFGNQAIQQVVQPRFTALLATDEASALRRVFQLSTAWSMAVSWPVYVVIGSMPLAYLSLFGGSYREAGVEVVVVMMLAMMLSVLGGPADTLLLMSGHSKTSMANGLLVVVVDIGLCLLLVPRLGIVGAALAWACAIAVRWVLTVVQIRRYLHVVPWSRAMAVVVTAVLVCLMLPMVLVGWLWTQTILSAAVTGTVGLLAYAAVLASERRALSVDSLEGLVRSRTAGADG
jgi:O-antigen/teichoic acid export membrane protein